MRSGEAVPRSASENAPKLLRVEDVVFRDVSPFTKWARIEVHIKAGKSDAFRVGRHGDVILDPVKWGLLYVSDLAREGRY